MAGLPTVPYQVVKHRNIHPFFYACLVADNGYKATDLRARDPVTHQPILDLADIVIFNEGKLVEYINQNTAQKHAEQQAEVKARKDSSNARGRVR